MSKSDQVFDVSNAVETVFTAEEFPKWLVMSAVNRCTIRCDLDAARMTVYRAYKRFTDISIGHYTIYRDAAGQIDRSRSGGEFYEEV